MNTFREETSSRCWSARAAVLTTLMAAAALFFGSGLAGAANESFVGTWRIDLERSDPMMGNIKVDNDYRLGLDGENLEVVRVFRSQGQESAVEWTLQTNGEPHDIPGMREPRTVKAKWKKNRLTVTYPMELETPRGTVTLDITELWVINKAGELEVRTSTRTQRGQRTRTEIFTRLE